MPERRAFKTDESFLEKLAIGAKGTQYVFEDLQRHGHRPVELERGSRSFKLWKAIKIKRVRVPDLLCTVCGVRVESRAKTKLEISMSHSRTKPERAWDAGMLDDDRVALVVCSRIGERPIDWEASPPVQYLSVRDLRQAFSEHRVKLTEAKGAAEGFEIRVTWPAKVVEEPGTVTEITENSLQYQPVSGRSRNVQLSRRGGTVLGPTVAAGQHIKPHQIVAAIVPVATTFLCRPLPDVTAHFMSMLSSVNRGDRYAAIKGLAGRLDIRGVVRALEGRMEDVREDPLVRLEAAANLMRLGVPAACSYLTDTLQGESLPYRLEAVIILGELPSPLAMELLTQVLLDTGQHPEVRAGAAWSLGELRNQVSLETLTRSLEETELGIRIEAARALAKLARLVPEAVLESFGRETDERRPGLAWALSQAGTVPLARLRPLLTSLDTRQWGAWVIGSQPSDRFIDGLEQLRAADPEVYFTATVLWKVLASWIYGLEEY